MNQLTITATGKNDGAKKGFRIDGPAEALDAIKAEQIGQSFRKDDHVAIWATKRHQSEMYAFVERYNAQQAKTAAPKANANAPRRQVVGAGSVSVGDTVNGYVVTGLGRAWSTGSDNSMYGVSPEFTSVQYAYFDGR